jgi:hypothetical protein
MKTNFFLCGVLVLLSFVSFAQTHSVYFCGGYNIPTTTGVIGSFHTPVSVEQNLSTFSQGIVLLGGYQYSVTKNFKLDLNISYLFGLTDEKYNILSDGGYTSYTSSNFSLTPSLNIGFIEGIFAPYTKFGISINFITLDETGESTNPFVNDDIEYSYKNNFTIGFMGGIGTNLLFDQAVIGFIEVQLNSITFYPDELEVTANWNGTKTTTVYNLVDKIDESMVEDNYSLKEDFPYSSIAINAGLRYVLQ